MELPPDDPDWRETAEAVEYAVMTVLVGGAFLSGLWAAVRSLF